MCLGIPAKLVSLDEEGIGLVDFGGVQREVSLQLVPEASIGDYVLVHVGFAIQRLDEEEAQETLQLLEEMFQEEDEGSG